MKGKDKMLKAAMKLAGGVFALTLMLGINAQAKDVTVNSAGELQTVLDEAKNLSETLTVTIPAGSDLTIERFLYVYPNTVINAEGATIRNTNPAFALIATPGDADPANITINGGTWEAGGNSFIDYSRASNVTVKGATIKGSGTNLVVLTDCQNVTLDNCAMSGSCILINGGKDNAIKGGSLTGSNETSFQIKADGTVVEGVTISNSANNAIRIDDAQGVRIVNNNIQNSYSIGIESVGGGNHTISGNYLSNSGYMGIRVATDQGSTISKNGLAGNAVREGSKGEGLVVDMSSDGTIVSGNVIQDTKGTQGLVGNGIIVNRSTNITVSDNIVSNSANHGIQVSYQSSKVTVSGNTISNSGRMGISVSRAAQADLKRNEITGSSSRGIAFDGKDYEGKTGIVSGSVEGCTVSGSKEQGIYIELANVSMSGNTIANNGTGGVAVTGSNVTADSNKIYQDTLDNTYSGISVTGGTRLTMNDNIISNFTACGVFGQAGTVVDGSNNQVNISSGGFKDSNGAYRIASGMSSNTIFAYSVGRTSASIETELSGNPTGVVVNGEKIETTGGTSVTVTYGDTDPAGVVVYTQDAKGNAICMQAPVNFSLKELKVPIPDDVNIEEVRAFVSRIYTVALKRTPDEDGLADWTNRLATGSESGAEVARGFFFSEEFTDKNLSDEQYVDVLYRTMFNREADQDGKKEWLTHLHNGVSREYVYHGFAESVEFDNLCNNYHIRRGNVTLGQPRDQNAKLTEFVSRVYYIALNRNSLDEDGINDWCGRILGGADPSDVVWGIVFSDEFRNRNLGNEEFVKVLYRTYFNREADAAGLADWLGQLDSGATREHVVNGFSKSDEFADLVESFGL